MRLIFLTCLAMIAFAANSVLNRLALVDAGMGPAAFAAVRLAAVDGPPAEDPARSADPAICPGQL